MAQPASCWLVKTEPDCFSIEDLARCPKQTTSWSGVRNYQARNFMRDQMKLGDRVLFYHSSADPPVVAGVASSLSTLSKAVNPVSAFVGQTPATVLFAGVTPGSTGLYQVNMVVPPDLPDNDNVPVTIVANGQVSNTVAMSVRTPR